jgi:guanine deaminase
MHREYDVMNPDDFMRRAIALSREKMDAGAGGPFGAVIVADGRIIAEGWNQVTSANDPTAHAEIVAIRAACAALHRFSLEGCEIYASCEPCPMCLAAIYWARLDRVYFANDRNDAARIGFDDDAIYREVALPIAARSVPTARLLPAEGRAAFDAWEQKTDKVRY